MFTYANVPIMFTCCYPLEKKGPTDKGKDLDTRITLDMHLAVQNTD